jgi:hypothetical protein
MEFKLLKLTLNGVGFEIMPRWPFEGLIGFEKWGIIRSSEVGPWKKRGRYEMIRERGQGNEIIGSKSKTHYKNRK